MAEVALEGVTKRYPNGVEAVRDLTLTVADGELVVLVGPSGCGKTTTLRLLAGLETPTSGSIRIGGAVVNRLPPRARNVALVFQRPALYPHLTVRDNLAIGLRLRHPAREAPWSWFDWLLPGGHERVEAWQQTLAQRTQQTARMLRLDGLLDRLPAQLSGGEQQRVALGRAVVRQPAAFLLDEPLSNLDARLRAETRRELHLLHKRLRATMIYVTHDQVEALTLGDRVGVLHQGIVAQVDEPLKLYEHPVNRFVAGFLGWPPMNFADGEVILQGGAPWFATQACLLALPPAGSPGPPWTAYRGRPLTVGIRPEDVRVLPGGDKEGAGVVMETTVVEALGASAVVTLQRDDWQVTAVTNGQAMCRVREKVTVVFDLTRAHLFDRSSGRALRSPHPGSPSQADVPGWCGG